MNETSRTIVLTANSNWNLANFRGGLIRALRETGYAPVAIAPQDPAADKRMRELRVKRIAVPIESSGLVTAATAVVLPSYREGMPRSLLEAAAMARPLIAADVPACRDVVENGVNGYLCTVRDASSIASATQRLAKLLLTEQLAMGEAARRKVQEQFNEEFVVQAYLDVLAGLNAAKPRI